MFSPITTEIERHFASSPRIFSSRQELIHALGCTWEISTTTACRETRLVLGRPPSPEDARLVEGNHIVVSTWTWTYAVHEAVHAFCGPQTLENETLMMALEISLYAMLKDPKERHEMFSFFSESYAEDENWELDEIADLMRRESGKIDFEPVWRGLVRDADDLWFTGAGKIRKSVLKTLQES